MTPDERIARYERELERLLASVLEMNTRNRRQHYAYSLFIYLLGVWTGVGMAYWWLK